MSQYSTSRMALAAATIDRKHDQLAHIKQAAPNWSAALPGALIGALGLGGIQGIRRLFASDRDKREGRAPSILNGLLLGALGGGGIGMGMPMLRQYLEKQQLRDAPQGTTVGSDSAGRQTFNAPPKDSPWSLQDLNFSANKPQAYLPMAEEDLPSMLANTNLQRPWDSMPPGSLIPRSAGGAGASQHVDRVKRMLGDAEQARARQMPNYRDLFAPVRMPPPDLRTNLRPFDAELQGLSTTRMQGLGTGSRQALSPTPLPWN